MKTVAKLCSYSFKEKKSTFIAYLCPLAEFDTTMQELKKEHKKARHIVFCLRGGDLAWRQSDDGEPRGSATKPMQANIEGNSLVDSAIIIVRYFGGVKLGIGPLFRAYNKAAKEVIKEAKSLSLVLLAP